MLLEHYDRNKLCLQSGHPGSFPHGAFTLLSALPAACLLDLSVYQRHFSDAFFRCAKEACTCFFSKKEI